MATNLTNNVSGTNSSDIISGGDGSDNIKSGNGDDVVNGGGGNDIIDGGNGNDTLDGGSGDDNLAGGNGDDTLNGGSGSDVLSGGNGDDLLIYNVAENLNSTDKYDGGNGNDTLQIIFDQASLLTLAARSGYNNSNDYINAIKNYFNNHSNSLMDFSNFGIHLTVTKVENMVLDLPVIDTNHAPSALASTASGMEDVPIVLSIQNFGFSDADNGDSLQSVRFTQLPTNGDLMLGGIAVTANQVISVADINNGNLVFVPHDNVNGDLSALFQVNDGEVWSGNSAQLSIHLEAVNDLPIANDDNTTFDNNNLFTVEDSQLVIHPQTLLANDSDVESANLQIIGVNNAMNGTVRMNADGTIVFTPAPNYGGPASFEYTIMDEDGGRATATAHINVEPVNDLPVANDDNTNFDNNALFTVEDAQLTINPQTLLANDSDVESANLQIIEVTNAMNGTVRMNADGTIVFTPDHNYGGPASFEYTVIDEDGGRATATAYINVEPVNDLPIANDDNTTFDNNNLFTVEDSQLSINPQTLLANDSDVESANLQIIEVTNAMNGTVRMNADGTIVFTPAPNYGGPASFEYTIIDADGGRATATAYINVEPVNDLPVANDDNTTFDNNALFTVEDAQLSINPQTLLANDSDVESANLQIIEVTNAMNGTVRMDADGTIVFTPAPNYGGPASFEYTVIDEDGGRATATAYINVEPVNDLPVANDDNTTFDNNALFTVEDSQLVIHPQTLLANDSDVESANLQIIEVNNAMNGTVRMNADGTIVFTPDHNYGGPASFEYTVMDEDGGRATATAHINVEPVNDLPVANDDNTTFDNNALFTVEDAQLTINPQTLLANDSDVESANLQIIEVNNAMNGTVRMNADGTIVFTPASNYGGPASFEYTVIDEDGGRATATAYINVEPVNDLPVANDDNTTFDNNALFTVEDSQLTINPQTLLANDSDVESANLQIIEVTNAMNGTVRMDADGTIVFTPAPNYGGPASFEYTVIDEDGGRATATAHINVEPVNDLPVANDDNTNFDNNALFTVEDAQLTINPQTLLANDSDVESANLQIIEVTNAMNGTVRMDADGTIVFTPAPNYGGPASFEYTVIDEDGGRATATAYINVEPVNDLPVANDDNTTFDNNALFTVEDSQLVIHPQTLLANDSDVESANLQIIEVNNAMNGTVRMNADGTIVFTPDHNYGGPASFEYTVIDEDGGRATATAHINVEPINDAPVAEDATYSVDAIRKMIDDGTPLQGQLSATDAEHDAISYMMVSNPMSQYGEFELGQDGNFNFYLNDNAKALKVGDTQEVTFTYKVEENISGLASHDATVTIEIHGTNTAPSAENVTYSMSAEGALDHPSISHQLNATDAENDPLTYALVSPPENQYGTIEIDGQGSFNFYLSENAATLKAGTTIPVSFDYQVTDSAGNISTATITIEIQGVNDAPINTSAGSIAGNEDQPINGLITAIDPDNDSLTYAVEGGPIHGHLIPNADGSLINADGSFTYQADPNFHGSDFLNYAISDGNGGVTFGTIDINVRAVNDAPDAENASYSMSAEGVLDGNVFLFKQLNATDVDQDALSYALVSPPESQYGTLSIDGDGFLSFALNANAAYLKDGDTQTVNYEYKVTDPSGASSVATIAIEIHGVNDAPIAENAMYSMSAEGALDGKSLSGQVNATDVDNDQFHYELLSSSASQYGSLDLEPGTGNFIFQLNGEAAAALKVGQTATVSYAYQAVESTPTGLVSDPKFLTITIHGANDAPIANDDMLDVQGGSPVTIQALSLIGNDKDYDGDPLSISSVANATNGQVNLLADGSVQFIPDANYTGPASFQYAVNDGHGGESQYATVNLNITINHPPVVPNSYELTTDEDSVIEGQLPATDSDGNSFTYLLVSKPSGQHYLDPEVSLNSDGSYTFNPGIFTQNMDDGGIKDYTFTYKVVEEGSGLQSNTGTVTIHIEGRNDAPSAVDTGNVISINEDTSNAFGRPTGFYFGFSDIDQGDTLFGLQAVRFTNLVADENDPTYFGKLLLNNNGVISTVTNSQTIPLGLITHLTFVPASNINGDFALHYQVSDGTAWSENEGTLNIHINPVNDAPVAQNLTFDVNEDVMFSGNLIAKDPDLSDAGKLTYQLVSAPSSGSLHLNADGSFTYTADQSLSPGQFAYTFTYQVKDLAGLSSQATATLHITGQNDAPVAQDANFTILEDATTLTGNLPAGSDIDGSPSALTYQLLTADPNFILNANGTFTYTQNPADYQFLQEGEMIERTFSYTVTDQLGGVSNPKTITVGIVGSNDAPTAPNQSITINDPHFTGQLTASDPDVNTVLTYEKTLGNVMQLSSDGSFQYDVDLNALYSSMQDSVQYIEQYQVHDQYFSYSGTGSITFNIPLNYYGTNNNDVINANNFNNKVFASTGDDSISTYDGDDEIRAGDGNDSINGGKGNDGLFGDNGNDTLNGGKGDDFIDGGNGMDVAVFSNALLNYTYHFEGNQLVVWDHYPDPNITDGVDKLTNVEQLQFDGLWYPVLGLINDGTEREIGIRWGDDNANNLMGNDYGNVIHGGLGDDSVSGLGGIDYIYGEAGNDHINGGTGNDIIDGGSGTVDVAAFNNAVQNYTYHFDQNNNLIFTDHTIGATNDGVDTLSNMEKVEFGGLWWDVNNDLIHDGREHVVLSIHGSGLNDNLTGTAGSDNLLGHDGDDAINGLGGDDFIDGGNGNDTAIFSGTQLTYHFADANSLIVTSPDGVDTLTNVEYISMQGQTIATSNLLNDGQELWLTVGEMNAATNGDDTITMTSSMNNTIYGEGGNDNITGSDSTDFLFGNDGNDTIFGGLGRDFVYGGNGDDLLIGGVGTDSLNGGAGNDTLIADAGDNGESYTGGAGTDTLVLGGNSSQYIYNFTPATGSPDAPASGIIFGGPTGAGLAHSAEVNGIEVLQFDDATISVSNLLIDSTNHQF